MARRTNEFQTIRSEGGLLPPDLLRRVLEPKEEVPGTRPEDYGLPENERINETITQSWHRLQRHWKEFRAGAEGLPEGEAGTGLTNDKWSLPLMRELGFGMLPTSPGPEIDGRTYAISRFVGPAPLHLIGCGLSLDRRAAGQRGAAAVKANEGRIVRLRGDEDSLGYLARMDLHENIGIEFESGNRLDETGRFLPLKQIDSDDDVFNTVNSICDLVLHQFDNANEFLPALEWAVNEIIDNIVIHSETVIPGVVCAQYFPNKHRLDVGICDLGRGIFASLATTRQLWSHGDAVTTALQRGVTRDPDVGQGNGMAGALEIAKSNGGLFHVWTGDVLFRAEKGAERGFLKIPEIPGTGVKFSLDTRRPVDLSSTWIAGGDWTFINIEAERIQESEGVNISEACINTGSRPPAERLRRKLLALLPEMEVPLVLDFKDVRAASSSFLDELLGRMAFQHELGDELFKTRIRIVGMNETMRNMANTVIAQRLGRGPIGAAEETSVEKAR